MANAPRRLALCTSVMQVVNAAAAMRLDSPPGETEDHMAIFHPALGNAVPKMLDLARRLGFAKIHDFSDQARQVQQLLAIRPLRELVTCGQVVNSEIGHCVDALQSKLGSGTFQRVYCRKPRHCESFFLRTVLGVQSCWEIEDGFGNYSNFERAWFNRIRQPIWAAKALLAKSIYISRGIAPEFVRHIRPTGLQRKRLYMVHPWPGAENISSQVIQILKEISPESDCKRVRVMIVGTLLYWSFGISVEEECDLYAHLVRDIAANNGVGLDEMLFRPHPRFPVEWLEVCRSRIPCGIDDSESPLAECAFTRPGLEAVYSFGSTASVNAQEIFGLRSYIVISPVLKGGRKHEYIVDKLVKHFGLPVYALGCEP